MSVSLLSAPVLDREVPVVSTPRRSVTWLLAPLEFVAEHSAHLLSKSLGSFASGGAHYALPRYLYVGPKGGGEILRVGIFATLNGDEPEGALALGHFLQALERQADPAQGFALFLYPVCNPTGYEDNTPNARTGRDLNREFWRESTQPEVRFLESEIWMQGFHGLITLRSAADSSGIHGFVQGSVLSESLLEPALLAASRYVPRNRETQIRGLPARDGIIHQGYPGILQAVPGLVRPPFEVTLVSPRRAPVHRQVEALSAALASLLTEFRYLQAIAQNI